MKARHAVMAAGAALAAVLLGVGTSGAQSSTEITLLHAIPGAPLDLVVDGSALIEGIRPGLAEDLSSSAGTQLVDVELIDPTDGSVVVSAGTLDLPATGNHSLVVHLDQSGTPVLTLFENNSDPTASAGDGRLTIRHAAAAPPLDVPIGTGTLATGLANGASQSVELAPRTISDAVLITVGGDLLASVPAFTVTEGVDLIVYVVGASEGGTITFLSEQVMLDDAAAATPTTELAADTTTTEVTSTTTTSAPIETTTTTTTTSAVAAPVAVNTGSPLETPLDANLLVIAILSFVVFGGSLMARRRVG